MQKTGNSVTWNAWGDTDPGRKRENNEDRILCETGRGVFVVADGMGGEAAGEVAAQQAVDFMHARLRQETGTVARRLGEAIAGANNEIYRLAERNPQWRGMACVLTAAVIEDGTLHIGHVGDSRLYRIRNGEIKKLTSDHSPVGQMEDSGKLTELEAMNHPRRNEVFRDVGSQLRKPDDADFVQYLSLPFERDSALVLCSDGLSDMLSSRQIMQPVLECAGNPQDTVARLIDMANSAGGKDNISVIVVEGSDFASSCRRPTRPTTSQLAASRKESALWGRWAFLLYGLIAGVLAFSFWQRTFDESSGVVTAPEARVQTVFEVGPGNPEFPRISKALEAARPGDRIVVADGEYEELLRLKDGVEITARNPGKAVLQVARAFPDSDAVISAHGIRNARVTGLVVRVEPAAGIAYGMKIDDSDVDISNVEVSGALNAGMLIAGNSSGGVAAGYFHGNSGPGIIVSGASSPYLVGNLIHANGNSTIRNRKHPGMYVRDSASPVVRRNIFSGNGSEPIRIQRQELKEKMMDNLFLNSATRVPVLVENAAR